MATVCTRVLEELPHKYMDCAHQASASSDTSSTGCPYNWADGTEFVVAACTRATNRQLEKDAYTWREHFVQRALDCLTAEDTRHLALHPVGWSVLHALVDCASEAQVRWIAASLDVPTVLGMAVLHSPSAIICIMLTRHACETTRSVADALVCAGVQLARTKHGSLMLSRVIQHMHTDSMFALMRAVMRDVVTLLCDPYANYVAQGVVMTMVALRRLPDVCDALAGHWAALSCNKYASNTLELVTRAATGTLRERIVREVTAHPHTLRALMADRYANFVVQTVVHSCTDPAEGELIYRAVRKHMWSTPYSMAYSCALGSLRERLAEQRTAD